MSHWTSSRDVRREPAETLALKALAWLAEDADRLGVFLGACGLSPADLAASADEPEFLGAVLDHLLGDEAQLLACARDLGEAPERFLPARATLPGGEVPHWT